MATRVTEAALVSRVSRLPRACIALTKSEENERLFAVHKRSEDTFFTGLADRAE